MEPPKTEFTCERCGDRLDIVEMEEIMNREKDGEWLCSECLADATFPDDLDFKEWQG